MDTLNSVIEQVGNQNLQVQERQQKTDNDRHPDRSEVRHEDLQDTTTQREQGMLRCKNRLETSSKRNKLRVSIGSA